MMWMLWILLVLETLVRTEGGVSNVTGHVRYTFYRSLEYSRAAGSRRVFGGAAAEVDQFPAVGALLDRYWATRCSAAALAPHWALTAAHCVTPRLAYLKYGARSTAATGGHVTALHYLYRHPQYRVLQEDDGRGMDVTVLHHDVGLVRTRDEIRLSAPPRDRPHPMNLHEPMTREVLRAMRRYDTTALLNEEVQVLGFGRTEISVEGEELYATKLRLMACGRGEWYHVVCGVGVGFDGGRGSGVCAGDSGGPVVFGGVQVAVTSLGPRECTRGSTLPVGAASVFTMLRPYVDIINATISDTDAVLRMRMISAATCLQSAPSAVHLALSLLSLRTINHSKLYF